MFAKVKSSMFIDAVQFELNAPAGNFLKAILKDDSGSVCSTFEKKVVREHEKFTWSGLNDLPYGKYTMELSQGNDEIKLSLVKRV